MLIKTIKWIVGIIILWISYLIYSILSFPSGTLSDSAEVAIVLGAVVSNEKPSLVFAERLNHAVNLYHAGKVVKLIFTGGIGENKKYAESEVALNFAIQKKVKADDILIETSSLTTRENLVNAQQILKIEEISTALIISDALHLKRAMKMARDLKIKAKPSATPTSRYQSLKKQFPFALREAYFYHHYLLFGD